jgi:hypothetical protein
MKTILVPAGGSASDDVTFETAYAATQCFNVSAPRRLRPGARHSTIGLPQIRVLQVGQLSQRSRQGGQLWSPDGRRFQHRRFSLGHAAPL